MEALQRRLCQRLRLAFDRARKQGARVLVTASAALSPPEDLLSLVDQASNAAEHSFFWEQPAERFAIAAIGAAATFCAQGSRRFADIAAACDELVREAAPATSAEVENLLFVGGFAFSADPLPDDPWQGFSAGRLVLPRLLVVRRNHQAIITICALVDAQSDLAAFHDRLAADLAWLQHPAPGSCGRNGHEATVTRYEAATTMAPELWERAVAHSVADIRDGRLDKLVLARACTIKASAAFDCGRIMRRLRHAYPSCVLFWVGGPGGNFLGATPEPLVRLSGNTVSTAAIAGSAAPGGSAAANRSLGHALLHSEKNRCEHAIVVQAIAAALAPLCEPLDVPVEPRLLRLGNVQHLITPISGQLKHSHHVLELVDRLHPSPAVAGHPREAALQLLQQREALNRGWYAGPIGWMDARHQGEFAVAIRSALVRGSEATVYAGAGIVAGSDPEAELIETRLKMQPLLSALLEL